MNKKMNHSVQASRDELQRCIELIARLDQQHQVATGQSGRDQNLQELGTEDLPIHLMTTGRQLTPPLSLQCRSACARDSFWMIGRVIRKLKGLRQIFSCPLGWQDAHGFHLGKEPVILAFLLLSLGALASPLATCDTNRRVPYASGGGYTRDAYEWHIRNTSSADTLYLNGVSQGASIGGSYSLNLSPKRDATGVLIGLIDTGVNDAIPDLQGAVVAGLRINHPWYTNSNYADGNGHGTQMASILVGNGTVIDGVAPGAKLLVVNESGYQTGNVAAAIPWCADRGAKVICLAWGTPAGDPDMPKLLAACQYASNVVIVCAGPDSALNMDDPNSFDYPTSFHLPNVVTITDMVRDGTVYNPYASAYGTNLLGAPGRVICCDSLTGTAQYASGTSPACAMAAGCVALLIHDYPNQTPEFYINLLKSECVPCPTNWPVYGAIDTSKLNFNPSFTMAIAPLDSGHAEITARGSVSCNLTLQSSPDLVTWTDCGTVATDASTIVATSASRQFWRLKL